MRISDWSSDVCSSDLLAQSREQKVAAWQQILDIHAQQIYTIGIIAQVPQPVVVANTLRNVPEEGIYNWDPGAQFGMYRPERFRSEEHTSELQSLMRISYAVFCLKKKTNNIIQKHTSTLLINKNRAIIPPCKHSTHTHLKRQH